MAENEEKVTTVVPKGLEVVTPVAGKLSTEQLQKFGVNALIFTGPFVAAFFAQLALGVEPKLALVVALPTLWGLLADLFKKLKDTTPYLREK